MILATGTLLTFPSVDNVNPDCFSQGYKVLEKLEGEENRTAKFRTAITLIIDVEALTNINFDKIHELEDYKIVVCL